MSDINRLNEHSIPDLCIEHWGAAAGLGRPSIVQKITRHTHIHFCFNLVWFISFLLVVITAAALGSDYAKTEYKQNETKCWTWHINSNQRIHILTEKMGYLLVGGYAIARRLPPISLPSPTALASKLGISFGLFSQFSFFIIKFKHSLVCFTRVNKLQNTYNVLSSSFFYQYCLKVN